MARPKVDPSKRKRVASACESCKRRKQKCDEKFPCQSCFRRNVACRDMSPSFNPHQLSRRSRITNEQDQDGPCSRSGADSRTEGPVPLDACPSNTELASALCLEDSGSTPQEDMTKTIGRFARSETADIKLNLQSIDETNTEVEIEDQMTLRMLEDRNQEKLPYYGDTTNISFFQKLRAIIETAIGQSAFTLDHERDWISNRGFDESIKPRLSFQLPDKKSVLVLVESFFVHTCGVSQIFDEASFRNKLEHYYIQPLSVDRNWLGQLFLVLAVGLSFANPRCSRDASIVNQLREMDPDQTQVFFFTAKDLVDPLTNLEDANLHTIQTLICMALYMIAHSMQDLAFMYCGVAVRLAYTIGLHREKAVIIFPLGEQATRQHVWRSLFVIERLLSASLGRPTAIVEEEILDGGVAPYTTATLEHTHRDFQNEHHLFTSSLEANVRSCRVIGLILTKVYEQRRVSTKTIRELANECIRWPELLPRCLHWRQAFCDEPRRANTIYHANMIHCHTMILLAKPFFVVLISNEVQHIHLRKSTPQMDAPYSGTTRSLSDACINASNHLVGLTLAAHHGGHLSPFNVLTIHYLFDAGLVLLTCRLVWPSESENSDWRITGAINVLEDFGKLNLEAKRTSIILRQFKDIVDDQAQRRKAETQKRQPNTSVESPNFQRQPAEQTVSSVNFMSQARALSCTFQSSQSSQSNVNSNPVSLSQGHAVTLAPEASLFDEEAFNVLPDLESTMLSLGPGQDLIISSEAIDFNAICHWSSGDGPILDTFDDSRTG